MVASRWLACLAVPLLATAAAVASPANVNVEANANASFDVAQVLAAIEPAAKAKVSTTAKASTKTYNINNPWTTAPLPTGFSAFAKTPSFQSSHFKVWNTTKTNATAALKHLEGTYACFVNDLGWKSTGLNEFDAAQTGPYWKTNVFMTDPLPGALGMFITGSRSPGRGFLMILSEESTEDGVLAHEYGHCLNSINDNWWRSQYASPWAETIAQFVDDTYLNSQWCLRGRTKVDNNGPGTIFNVRSGVFSYSYFTLVNATYGGWGLEYSAWPFLTYLHYNPDSYPRLGNQTLNKMQRAFPAGSKMTPLHSLQQLTAPDTTAATIVTRYWSRMAFADIGHPYMRSIWNRTRNLIDYDNLDLVSSAANTWTVKPAKRPAYMGASLIPLKDTNSTVSVTITGNMVFRAAFAISSGGVTRVTDFLPTGLTKTRTVPVGPNDEVVLVVVNAPEKLLTYSAHDVSSGPVAAGLDFKLTFVGARPALGMNATSTSFVSQNFAMLDGRSRAGPGELGHNIGTVGKIPVDGP